MKSELDFAIALSQAAGDIMLEYFKVGVDYVAKKDNSPVTEADIKINNLVIEKVKEKFPNHGVLGEEASWNLPSEFTWVCDPIDGTRPFVYGLPYSVFSLALVKNGVPVLAVVYDPHSKRLYRAEKDKGAFLNDQKIHVNKKSEISQSVIGAGLHSPMYGISAPRLMDFIGQKIHRILSLQCVVQEMMLIATGQIEGNIFVHDTAHDIAAGKLIVEEAGGLVTDLFGNEQRYDQPLRGALISNGVIHEDLAAIVANATKDNS